MKFFFPSSMEPTVFLSVSGKKCPVSSEVRRKNTDNSCETVYYSWLYIKRSENVFSFCECMCLCSTKRGLEKKEMALCTNQVRKTKVWIQILSPTNHTEVKRTIRSPSSNLKMPIKTFLAYIPVQ